jgi:quercetin dioxygenase-like cupin family protein
MSIQSGDVLHNPVTGETMLFVEAAADTGGEYVLIEVAVEPNGFVAAAHVHPYQTETFEITGGEITFDVGGETIVALAGDTVVVEPGTGHRFRNTGETAARFRCEIRPALQFEQLISTMFALAADGKTNRKGMPNPLWLAVIAKSHFDDVRLPFPPQWLQRLGLAMGSPAGRLVGYGPTYEPAQPSDVSLACRDGRRPTWRCRGGIYPAPATEDDEPSGPRPDRDRVHDRVQAQSRRRQSVLHPGRPRIHHYPLQHARLLEL